MVFLKVSKRDLMLSPQKKQQLVIMWSDGCVNYPYMLLLFYIIPIYQIIMMYILNLHNVICQKISQ